jgi:hypothetical protein
VGNRAIAGFKMYGGLPMINIPLPLAGFNTFMFTRIEKSPETIIK